MKGLAATNCITMEGFSQHNPSNRKNAGVVAGLTRRLRLRKWNREHNKPPAETKPHRNERRENNNHFEQFTSYHSPFTVRYHSHRVYTYAFCSRPKDASTQSAAGGKLSGRQHGGRGGRPSLTLAAAHSTQRLVCFRLRATLRSNSTQPLAPVRSSPTRRTTIQALALERFEALTQRAGWARLPPPGASKTNQ